MHSTSRIEHISGMFSGKKIRMKLKKVQIPFITGVTINVFGIIDSGKSLPNKIFSVVPVNNARNPLRASSLKGFGVDLFLRTIYHLNTKTNPVYHIMRKITDMGINFFCSFAGYKIGTVLYKIQIYLICQTKSCVFCHCNSQFIIKHIFIHTLGITFFFAVKGSPAESTAHRR